MGCCNNKTLYEELFDHAYEYTINKKLDEEKNEEILKLTDKFIIFELEKDGKFLNETHNQYNSVEGDTYIVKKKNRIRSYIDDIINEYEIYEMNKDKNILTILEEYVQDKIDINMSKLNRNRILRKWKDNWIVKIASDKKNICNMNVLERNKYISQQKKEIVEYLNNFLTK